ncbi:MAG: TonB-dependent receptor [Xanthomonadales bacterium]|nr:TonB-dependent receptor [Xanthomonadales bacterium]
MFMPKKAKLALALSVALATAAPVFAQSTAAGLGGQIFSSTGELVEGATVEIVHVPTGTRSVVTTDANGRYNARGLRVGGPYTITVSKDGRTAVEENVFLTLADVAAVTVVLDDPAATLATVSVVGSIYAGGDIFMPDRIGAKTNVTQDQIEALPSIRRSLEDYVRLDPRIVQVDKERGGISAGGQNNRYNNIRIDGVPTNDQFGLNDSGLPALNQPISIDWIQEFNIGISDYDVTQKDFVGANINAVTKSGTNEFTGGIYGVYRDKDMIRKRDDRGAQFRGFSDEWTAGAYVGGPIIKDTLFFFLGYEEFERSSPGPTTGIQGSGATNIVNISAAELAQIRQIAAGYGLSDIGSEVAPGSVPNTDEKIFARIDWNINDDHRAAFRYNKTEGSTLRFNTGTNQIQLDSNRFTDNISFENYAFLLYSDWSDIFSSEFNMSYAEYRSLPTVNSLFPQVTVNVRPGASVVFGRERSRHANQLEVDTWTGYWAGDVFLGDHTVRFGLDYERNDIYNLFLQDVFGNYTFANIDQFAAGNWQNYRIQQPRNGNINSVAASFKVENLGFFLQDTWAVTPNLNVLYGFRVDRSKFPDAPAENALFRQVYGIDNRNTPSGNTVQPRAGFNYTFNTERQTQLRGGFGLFQGSPPGVWLSNSYSNPGVLVDDYTRTNGSGVSFDPNNPLLPGGAAAAAQLVNALSADFQQPTVWKMNLAFERELPWLGLVGGIEALWVKTEEAVAFTQLNLGTPTGRLPDGRMSYWRNTNPANFTATGFTNATGQRANRDTRFTDAILLENTGKGEATNYTLSLEKPWQDNWYAKLAYTYGESNENSPGTSSVAFSNYSNRAVFNQNEIEANTANYEFRHRFTSAFSYRWNFFSNANTTFSMFHESRSGRPFSYTFIGDANGDQVNGNDLFFIPNRGDVQLVGTDAAQAAFWNYIENTRGLRENQGSVARRNANRAPWMHQIDLRISQDIPFFWDTKGQIYLDILNVSNLINKDWGHIDEVAFPYNLGVARFRGVNDQGQYVYDVSNFATGQPSLIRKDVSGESRWAAQIGFRFEF